MPNFIAQGVPVNTQTGRRTRQIALILTYRRHYELLLKFTPSLLEGDTAQNKFINNLVQLTVQVLFLHVVACALMFFGDFGS